VRSEVARGRAISPRTSSKSLEPWASHRIQCKINSEHRQFRDHVGHDESEETSPLRAITARDTVMGPLHRRDIPTIASDIQASPVPIGPVPSNEALSRVKRTEDLTIELMLEVIEEQAEQGS